MVVPDLKFEAWLIRALSPEQPFSFEHAKYQAMLCVLVAFDRKVGRDFFADMLADMVDTHKTISDIEAGRCAAKILMGSEPDRGVPKLLGEALEQRIEDLKDLRAEALKKMKLIAEMPPPGTKLS